MLGRILLHILPKYAFTQFMGWFSQKPISRIVVPWYVRHFQIDLDEVDSDPDTLLALFTRQLVAGRRPISDDYPFVCPVDGLVLAAGRLDPEGILRIKGDDYRLDELLGCPEDEAMFRDGYFALFYLSPRDYHRIHASSSGVVTRWTHIPGHLYPVNQLGFRHVRLLYAKNERLVSFVESEHGPYAMVKIGAMGVGRIHTSYAPNMSHKRRNGIQTGTVTEAFERGQEVGYFSLGSSVLVIWGARTISDLLVRSGQRVHMGEPLAK